MTIVTQLDLSASRADPGEVSAGTRPYQNPLAGLTIHQVTETADGIDVVDIQECHGFRDSSLLPRIQKFVPEDYLTS